jgi:hypothetical protein
MQIGLYQEYFMKQIIAIRTTDLDGVSNFPSYIGHLHCLYSVDNLKQSWIQIY